jgi:hypothetical protein
MQETVCWIVSTDFLTEMRRVISQSRQGINGCIRRHLNCKYSYLSGVKELMDVSLIPHVEMHHHTFIGDVVLSRT